MLRFVLGIACICAAGLMGMQHVEIAILLEDNSRLRLATSGLVAADDKLKAADTRLKQALDRLEDSCSGVGGYAPKKLSEYPRDVQRKLRWDAPE